MARWSSLLVLLMVALVAANAQCFAYCLTQIAAAGHCHENGKTKAGHCSTQHDLRMESAASVIPGLVGILAEVPDLALDASTHQTVKAPAPSPPVPLGKATLLPLRV